MCEQLWSDIIESFLSRRFSELVSLLGGNVRAFFCHGTFHKEHEESERGGQDPEGEEAVEISKRG